MSHRDNLNNDIQSAPSSSETGGTGLEAPGQDPGGGAPGPEAEQGTPGQGADGEAPGPEAGQGTPGQDADGEAPGPEAEQGTPGQDPGGEASRAEPETPEHAGEPAPWCELSQARRMAIVEAMIFAAEHPLSLEELRNLLGADTSELRRLAGQLLESSLQHNRGVTLEEVAGGYVFRTKLELSPWLRALVKTRPPRLSRPALQCLAIVAYHQPVTRAEVEAVRGVESGSMLRALLEKRLVRVLGRKEDVGRPMIYGTTREFLEMFGLKDLTGLPTLRDLTALTGRTDGPVPEDEEDSETLSEPLSGAGNPPDGLDAG